jgi:nicotinate-nucleotide pyrophosphorylase (carboxylating)
MPENAPDLHAYIDRASLESLLMTARDEDLGAAGVDVTSQLCVPPDLRQRSAIVARAPGVLAGGALLAKLVELYNPSLTLTLVKQDGERLEGDDVIARLAGPARSMLAVERVALNFLGHLSGIATLTKRYVQAVDGTPACILDTRKTLPGLRGLEKYAVACGGGATHRMGLYDAVLIKDNHLAHMPVERIGAELAGIIENARRFDPPPAFVEVEVDTLDQLQQVLQLNVDIVLLDNMSLADLRRAVTLRDDTNPSVKLEASGGVTFEAVSGIAATGIDRISVGALTHSAPALDLALDFE